MWLSLLMTVAGLGVVCVVILYLIGRRAIRRAASNIHEHGNAIYSGAHEYVPVSLADFPHLDAGWYERTTAELEAAGFRHLGDLADVTVNQAGGAVMPTVARVLLDADGTTIAALYHARVKGSAPTGQGNFHVVDVETACTDGTFVMSSNAPSVGQLDDPPEIDAEYIAVTATATEVADHHRGRMQRHLAARPGRGPLASRSLEDVIAHQQRLDEIKAAFRQGRPLLFSEDELRRLAPSGERGEATAVAVGKELERLHRN